MSHWDDRNKINTIPRVWIKSNKPRSEWKKQMFVLGDLMEKEWDLGDI